MGSSSKGELPFYPKYKIELRGHVTIWWFYKEFSQSFYNYKKIPIGSNACTLITVLLSAYFYNNSIKIMKDSYHDLPEAVIFAFAKCILDGNEIHDKLRKRGALENVNLTVPEAIDGADYLVKYIIEWVNKHKDLP